ncbi:hypothetical protein HIM_12551 [Hirsutella minnesotensis 3608]|uniref:Uncharacterized protein n=1 Tax=Hirsutella minnesotensis 3608 TaxID=1043627 RepID=A0A0F7ZZZ0_9HYPO|nr:hypothetical protein HIM_12551 [Hirsutella minnesotensis 3608]
MTLRATAESILRDPLITLTEGALLDFFKDYLELRASNGGAGREDEERSTDHESDDEDCLDENDNVSFYTESGDDASHEIDRQPHVNLSAHQKAVDTAILDDSSFPDRFGVSKGLAVDAAAVESRSASTLRQPVTGVTKAAIEKLINRSQNLANPSSLGFRDSKNSPEMVCAQPIAPGTHSHPAREAGVKRPADPRRAQRSSEIIGERKIVRAASDPGKRM